MDVVIIALVALFASALTLVSGFGLGTILLPAFALFFPVPVAVAATGIVHLLNNLFKGALLYKRADWRLVMLLGIPAIPSAVLGAWLLAMLGDTPRIFEWTVFGGWFGPTGAGLAVGVLLIVFAALELQTWFHKLAAPPNLMPVGGVLTGFFGGLTGQQGALRSMFLLRAGLKPGAFISTGVMIAILVDLSRLAAYAGSFTAAGLHPSGRQAVLVAVGTLAAFVGAYVATSRIEKMTVRSIRTAVAGLMLIIGAALAAGLVGAPA